MNFCINNCTTGLLPQPGAANAVRRRRYLKLQKQSAIVQEKTIVFRGNSPLLQKAAYEQAHLILGATIMHSVQASKRILH